MFNEVSSAYLEFKTGVVDEEFIRICLRTLAYGQDSMEGAGSVSVFRLIEEWRRAIMQSARTIAPLDGR